MQAKTLFPSLDGVKDTRDTLHWYSQAVGAIPRTHAEVQPRWQHIALRVSPKGLETSRMLLPGGGKFSLLMDLTQHKTTLSSNNTGEVYEIDMRTGLTAKEFGEQIIRMAKSLGLNGKYAEENFDNSEPRKYDSQMAEKYLSVLNELNRIFNKRRDSLSGECSPVLLWPHGFDLGFVWFGTRIVDYEENGVLLQSPAQLNIGFSPGDSSFSEPYFYSNPWPFEMDKLVHQPLPKGARWYLESWQGSILPYNELVNQEQAEDRLLEYARAVYDNAAPNLMAKS